MTLKNRPIISNTIETFVPKFSIDRFIDIKV